jgi:hypothetical protein
MRKINLFLTLIAVVMLVGLTNCKKETEATAVRKYVGTVNGSFIAQDVNVSIAKDFDPFAAPLAVTRNWIMYAVNSPFYAPQHFALVKGLEFVQGSAADIWWSTNGNNPVSFAASQAVYSNLTPAEPVRLIMETKDNSGSVAYLGILDFDPTQAQFPLIVVGKRLGDVVTLNTDALTKLPGANLTITANFQLANVDVAATELGNLNPATGAGVSGALDFSNILYGSLVTNVVTVPNGSGDFPLYSGIDKKVFGDITITITEAASSSSPGVNGSVIVLHVPSSAVGIAGMGTKLILSTSKLGWYDSSTINMSDDNIQINVVNVPVDGQDNQNGGGNQGGGNNQGNQNPPTTPNITLKFDNSSPYQVNNAPEIFLTINSLGDANLYAAAGTDGEIVDMGAINLITNNNLTGPPTTGFSSNALLIQGHSYVVRYRKALDYQSSSLPYNYGIFYVNSQQSDGFTITYQGPFSSN